MAVVSDAVLKSYFTTGSLPTESQFADLVDSKLSNVTGSNSIVVTTSGTVRALRINELNGNTEIGFWKGTQAQYDAIGSPSPSVLYIING